MIPVVDPFMASAPATGIQRGRGGFYRSKDGAPYVSDPSGDLVKSGARKGEAKRLKYGSPSSAGTLIENDVGLTKHKQRKTFLGIGMSEDLREACRALADMDYDSEEFNKAADTIVVEADKLTRAWLAADRGSHGHLICEYRDRGLPLPQLYAAGRELGLDDNTQVDVANAWSLMLEDNGLEVLAVEASCVDDKWRLAGTLDRIVRTTRPLTFVKASGELVVIPAYVVLILDLKFGKCRLAHPIQIASYDQSVPYNTELETRGEWPWELSHEHALIAHGSFDPPSIELVWVDLVAGREHGGECVVQAKAWAARDDVFSVAQIVEGAVLTEPLSAPSTHPLDLSSEPSPSGSLPTPVPGRNHLAGSRALCPRVDGDSLTPDPARLALVDARAALCASPDEGADWSSEAYELSWDQLKACFDALPPACKTWRSLLVGQATRRGVPFHVQQARTERRYYINRAVIYLADANEAAATPILRELLAHVIGDVALFAGVEPGHALGSLSASEAARFAAHVDQYLSEPVGAA